MSAKIIWLTALFGAHGVEGRQNRPPVDVGEVVRDHAQAAKLQVDVAEQGLVLIERQETHFGVDRHRALEALAAALEDRELRSLHVDLEHIQRRDLATARRAAASPRGTFSTTAAHSEKPVKQLSTAGLGSNRLVMPGKRGDVQRGRVAVTDA